jgi:diguanylate cyclase (GGDEF)-like protein/PAS domain S-box-containing protein
MTRDPWVTFSACIPQILSLILISILAIVTWKKKESVKWGIYFLLVLGSLAVWALADILEISATSLNIYLGVIKLAYLGIATIPLFWFLFVVDYIGKRSWITPTKIFLTSIIPFLTIIFSLTNESFHLMRTVISYDASGQFSVAKITYGPWFWVHTANSYILLLFALILLVYSSIHTNGMYLGQKIFLVAASLAPWISNVLFLTKITRADYTSSAFAVLALALFISVYRFRMMNIVPIARDIVVEKMQDGVFVLDRDNRFVDVNQAGIEIFSYYTDRLLGKTTSEVFPHASELIENNLFSLTDVHEIGLPLEHPEKFYSVQITHILSKNGDFLGNVVVFRDATEQKIIKNRLEDSNLELENRVKERTNELLLELENRKKAEEALRESEERYSLALEGANDGIWDWNLETNEIFYSRRWKNMLGYEDDEIPPNPDAWFGKVVPEDIELLNIEISRHLENLSPLLSSTHRLRKKDGSIIWVLCRGMAKRAADGFAFRMSGSLTDITLQKQFEQQILHDAVHDTLTGLPNRTFLHERLGHTIRRGNRLPHEQFAVLFLDLDRFKHINDSLGHAAGDQLLIECANRLRACIRDIDTVARLGGDEFIVLVESVANTQEVERVVSRVIKSLGKPVILENREITISASIGIVVFSGQYDVPEDILRDADIAMYQAKKYTLKRYEFFSQSMLENANKRLQMEIDLRRGLDLNEFEMYYQPIVQVKPRELSSFEALIRWNQPSRGIISPLEFIHLAEENGMIIPIGHWIIRDVCRQVSEWKKFLPPESHISINFNLSSRQFSDPTLIEKITDAMRDFNIDGSNLVMEITESTIIEDRENVTAILEKIRALGIQIHLDDFGTGYSSLSYLHSLPFDAFKIDRSFVNQICTQDDCANIEIIQTIISLGRELGKKVVAEGVETNDELAKLMELNCGFIQGYLVSKPLNREAATAFLLEKSRKVAG